MNLDGATRLIAIVGDPIAQVKSPAGVTASLQARGRNAIVVPMHVTAIDLDRFVHGASLARNLDGIIVTIPHKFAMTAYCTTLSARAKFLGAVNTLRRNADGTWHGDMFDGLGFVAHMQHGHGEVRGKRALIVGAGGAGTAIAHALLEAGTAHCAIHDADWARRDHLIARLSSAFVGSASLGTDDPSGFDIVVNATPLGMRLTDPLPFQPKRLTARMVVGDVITAPVVSPLLEQARSVGCRTQTGVDMFNAVRELIVDFLTA